jgi:hypothetical protein
MALILTAYFVDGSEKAFTCEDDEEATMKRADLLEFGHEEKTEDKHTFYPAHSITKIIIKQE